jgi:formylglycine-generating enzyme required for sulfatase activity
VKDQVNDREMVSIPGGIVTGSRRYACGKNIDETGVFIEGRTVRLSPFALAKYETTYNLWHTVYQWAVDEKRGEEKYIIAHKGREGDGINDDYSPQPLLPSDPNQDGISPTEKGKYKPVMFITWLDAVVWCNAYSEMTGRKPVYRNKDMKILRDSRPYYPDFYDIIMDRKSDGYRLPTEAEWEFAARGGNSEMSRFSDIWAGTKEKSKIGKYAWYVPNARDIGWGKNSFFRFLSCWLSPKARNNGWNHSDFGAHIVGTKLPNAIGLYDMSGNAWEWCWDWYDLNIEQGDIQDPIGPENSPTMERIERGGSWGTLLQRISVSLRAGADSSNYKSQYASFRVAYFL